MTAATTLTAVSTGTIACLDNHGEPCQYCSSEGVVVQVQLYYTLDGEREMEAGCRLCMFHRMHEIERLGGHKFHWEMEEK